MPNQSTRLATGTARANMRILELENRCTGNRTVGSNPTLSANTHWKSAKNRQISQFTCCRTNDTGGKLV